MSTTTTGSLIKGGEWLVKPGSAFETYVPEDYTEEQMMIRDMCIQFLQTEVLPVIDRIDKMEPGLMPALMDKAGEQGLLGASVPEEHQGLGKDFETPTLLSEALGGGYPVNVAIRAHAAIGTWPI